MPEFASESGFGGLIGIVGVVAVMCIVAGLVHLVFSLLINRGMRGETNSLPSRILRVSRGPAVLFTLILGIFFACLLLIERPHPTFDFANGHDIWLVRIWVVTVIAQASHLGSRIIQELFQWYMENVSLQRKRDLGDRLMPQARRVTPIVVYAVGALMALDAVGISITPLIAGLGIGGIAVALALQPTLSNLFSGTFMVSEGELNEGDFIELDGGPSGFVVDVSWRSAKIRDRFNNLIMIPNSRMMESVMTNYFSDSREMSVIVECGVSYDSDLERVEEVALDVAGGVRDDIEVAIDEFDPVARFTAFGDSNIDFVVVMRAEDRLGTFVVKHELIKRLRARFGREGIEINYPVRKLLLPPDGGIEGLLLDADERRGA